ncbi:MAG: dihydropteroate synthase [Rhodobacteraceae bacterium]|nr:dihydropteroate synthase [Paracoccaceae bacterium]
MLKKIYLRPLPIGDPEIKRQAFADGDQTRWPALLAGGPLCFVSVETLTRRQHCAVQAPGSPPPLALGPIENRGVAPLEGLCAVAAALGAPLNLAQWREAVSTPRESIAGVSFNRPQVMAVVNVTPDSFSDGGVHFDPGCAVAKGLEMAAAGADILDIGGESTRPGAAEVPYEEELSRVLPVIRGLREAGCTLPISIDTRKARVAIEAFEAGARLFNDVSALSHDPDSLAAAAELCAAAPEAGVILCHSISDPQTMQNDPRYDDALLDVYDALSERLNVCADAGVPMERIIVDPGIGFGKTLEHNVDLIRGLALFHGLGRPILLGVSRKRFIGTLSGVDAAADRGPGSIAAGLLGVSKGAQILRVHDVSETVQALRVWNALTMRSDAPTRPARE